MKQSIIFNYHDVSGQPPFHPALSSVLKNRQVPRKGFPGTYRYNLLTKTT